MTIIAFHYTEQGFLAVADGLISRGGAEDPNVIRRVIDQADKIAEFVPSYKYPRVALGYFSGFREVKGKKFCICYAGNFTIARSIIDKFIEKVTYKLVLRRDSNSGEAKIFLCEDGGDHLRYQHYTDDYNFIDNEIKPLPMDVLVYVLKRVMQEVCRSFCKNAMEQPDVEIIIFGEEEVDHQSVNRAEMFICKSGTLENANILQRRILPWSLIFLGDKTLITALQDRIVAHPLFDPNALVAAKDEENGWNGNTGSLRALKRARDKTILKHVLTLVYHNKGTVGGDCIVADSGRASTLKLRKIRNEDIPTELE